MTTVFPFGPQHPILLEPLQLKLVTEDEIVQEVIPRLGYVHRGLEGLCTSKDFRQMVQVVERICGICSAIHGLTYCRAIEGLMEISVPARARYLRVIWSELHRAHSHLLWLGILADSVGFEALFMQIWRIREKILDLLEYTAGNRIVISVNTIGGVRRDITEDQASTVMKTIDQVYEMFSPLNAALLNDYAMKVRTVGKGILSADRAYELGTVGPVLRASGIAQDIRMTGYSAYNELEFKPVTESAGDIRARISVRYREVLQSIDLVRKALQQLPGGEIRKKVTRKKKPQGEYVVRSEQPRGEVLYYVKASGRKYLDRLRVRTPTFANLPALMGFLPGMDMADVPLAVFSLDPCIACTER